MVEVAFDGFEVELQNTLYNLYDPAYAPAAWMFEVCGAAPEGGLDALREKLIAAVEEMNAGGTLPDTAKAALLYRVLHHRFIQSLSQERAAEALGMSTRHLRRKQNEAVHALAVRLWSRRPGSGPAGAADSDAAAAASAAAPGAPTGPAWLEAILREVRVLNENAPGVSADLNQSLRRAVEMLARLHPSGCVELAAPAGEPAGALEVDAHPTVLCQLILTAIEEIRQAGLLEPVQARVEALPGPPEQVALIFNFLLAPGCAAEEGLPDPARITALAQAAGGQIETTCGQGQCTLRLVFPRSRKVRVLVVDDNLEIAQLYRRYAAGTRYEITHLTSGQDLARRIAETQPDVLVIDILLPGPDGWDLLARLKQNPRTRATPVLVCSVLGSEEMARSLGAAGYLPKPVDRRAFLEAIGREYGAAAER